MDFDNMKEIWIEMSARIEKQEKVTNEIILKMAQEGSKNRFSKIFRGEMYGAIGALACMVFIILNLSKLDTTVTVLGGILSIIICGIYIWMWSAFIKKAKKVTILNNSYKQTLQDFSICKKAYYLNKKLDYLLGLALLISICPVVFKITRNVDVLSEVPLTDLLMYLLGGGITYSIVVYMIFMLYDKQINEIDKLLKDLEE